MTFEIVLVCFLAFLTVNVTVYFPAFLYVCFAFLVVTVFVLSPKFQDAEPVPVYTHLTVPPEHVMETPVGGIFVVGVAASAVADNKIMLIKTIPILSFIFI